LFLQIWKVKAFEKSSTCRLFIYYLFIHLYIHTHIYKHIYNSYGHETQGPHTY
jgi:hypothetical protein